jgi:Icc protein
MIVLAHLSDPHFDGSARNAERAAQVMAYLSDPALPIDAILVTGDIADHGLPTEYEQAAKILSAPHPVLTCPGNHDVRGAYREVLLGEPASNEPINQLCRMAGATFAMCDSSIPGEDAGLLADETLAWLEGVLGDTAEGTPIFVCFHHPPVVLHAPLADAIRLRQEERLADLIARHPQVVAVLCGHAHTPAASTFAGRPVLVAPGVTSTLKLPFEPGDTIDLRVPPALAFHILDDDWRLTSHYRLAT